METRNLGNSSLRVSLVGLGCNNFGGRTDLEGSRKVVHKALDLGITLFDTADIYGGYGGSENCLGQILGDRRKDIVLATKFGMAMNAEGTLKGGSRTYVMAAAEASLKRLKTDWIDLYQIHTPDAQTPIEETLRALDDLVRQGKVRHIGCSNFAAWQAVDAQWTARHLGLTPFMSCQDEYSLLARQVEAQSIPAMRAHGMGLLPFFPLANGLLTGKYRRDALPEGSRLSVAKALADRTLTPQNWDRTEKLQAFCTAQGRTLLELAFSWLAMQPAVASVIAGASKPEQVEMNVRSVGWKLSQEQLAQVDAITR